MVGLHRRNKGENWSLALTMTLYWDTEMLLGWTLSLTHCFISEAKRRGSDDRSHFSFLVHLGKKKMKRNMWAPEEGRKTASERKTKHLIEWGEIKTAAQMHPAISHLWPAKHEGNGTQAWLLVQIHALYFCFIFQERGRWDRDRKRPVVVVTLSCFCSLDSPKTTATLFVEAEQAQRAEGQASFVFYP